MTPQDEYTQLIGDLNAHRQGWVTWPDAELRKKRDRACELKQQLEAKS